MLEVRDIRKSFDGFPAVDGVSFAVPARRDRRDHRPERRRQVDAVQPDHRPHAPGRRPRRCSRTATSPAWRRTTSAGWAWAARSSAPTSSRKLTVFENVQAAFIAHRRRGAQFLGRSEASTATRPRRCSSRSGSLDKADAICGTLSHGNQKQLELGIALARDPEILLLDEPTAGMSAAETRETIRLIERIAAERGAHAALHRARHGGRVLDRAAHRGAAPGPPDRRRHAGGGARRSRGAARLPRESGT